MLTTPVFLPWRTLWDAQLADLTSRVDELATLRQSGYQAPPSLADLGDLVLFPAAAQTAGVQVFTPEFVENLKPLLKACVWPRWLLLEELLDHAASSGDLHLSALALRTQIEELDVLQVAAKVLLHQEEDVWDEHLIGDAVRTLQTRIFPRSTAKDKEELEEKASDKDFWQRSDALQEAFDRLSEYVHPNYGSHVLSVRPHSLVAAKVLVEAFVTIYECFFSLPWANEAPVEKPQNAFFILADDTIPALRESVLEDGWPQALETSIEHFRHLGKCESNWNFEAEWPTDVEAIQALKERSVDSKYWPLAFRTVSGINRYSHLVMLENQLTVRANSLSDSADSLDGKARLPLLVSSLCFSIHLTEYKLTSMAYQAAHLINVRNVLGAALVVRSILEHHALAVELSSKLQRLWSEAEKRASCDANVTEEFTRAEKHLARVLAGTSDPSGLPSGWRGLWQKIVTKHYNVLIPVQALNSKQAGTLQLYGLLSHIMHGTVATGGDLLGAGGEGWRNGHKKLAAQLTIILSEFCSFAAMMERQSESMIIGSRLETLQSKPDPLDKSIRLMRILKGNKLKRGRDVFGDGTQESPYYFREGLTYHHAFYSYLEQEGIQMVRRTLALLGAGFGDEVEVQDGRKLYFANGSFSE